MSAQQLFIRDVGVYRASKNNCVDEGDDGVLWLPKKRLAAVADGIGGDGGHGPHDLKRFEQALKRVEDTRNGIREAFFSLFGEQGESTFVSLLLPQTFNKRALVLHAGDSHCLRLRKANRKVLLSVLTCEHTIWEELADKNRRLRSLKERFDHVIRKEDVEHVTNKRYLCSWIRLLEGPLQGDPRYAPLDGDLEDYSTHQLRNILLYRIRRCRMVFYLCLANTSEDAKWIVGAGMSPTVRDGDRFALVTDGIYRDVLTDHEIEKILLRAPSAVKAAKVLVQYSMLKGLKTDDRAAVVIDVTSEKPRQQRVRPVRKSLGAKEALVKSKPV